jgi:2-methylisocitrate lyase-like PEP mutase family enzyme
VSALGERAELLRRLHRPGDPLVLPNAWDPPSARRFAAAGAAAIATTSVGVAEALGYEDQEGTPPGEMLAAVGRIAAAVDLPVTADLETGYGLAPSDLIAGLLDAGAVGLNLEDTDHRSGRLVDPERHAEGLAAVKEAGRAAGVDVVLNARIDVFLRASESDDPKDLVDAAVERARAYAAAGADSVYPIGARGRDAVRRLAAEAGAPVNVVVAPGGLSRSELAELGVARISFGGGLAEVALEAATDRLEQFMQS